MNFALDLAGDKGFGTALLVGNPVYYLRFGYLPAAQFNIENVNGIPGQYVLAKELKAGSLRGIKKGKVDFFVW